MTTRIPGFSITPSAGWSDITDDVAGETMPLTFARPDGVGALQFSVAFYHSGQLPDFNSESLHRLLHDFAQSSELGPATDLRSEVVPLHLAAASFQTDSFFRVWYVSEGRSVALATYTCDPGEGTDELPDCEQMVRTLSFVPCDA